MSKYVGIWSNSYPGEQLYTALWSKMIYPLILNNTSRINYPHRLSGTMDIHKPIETPQAIASEYALNL